MGTTPTIGPLWWGLLGSAPFSAAAGDVSLDPITISTLLGCVVMVVAEGTAWAAAEPDQLCWRSVFRRRTLQWSEIACFEERQALFPGQLPVLVAVTTSGRRRWVLPTTAVGRRRLDEFKVAAEARMDKRD
jgi:hypothetical protein